MMSVKLIKGPIATQTTNRMFNPNATPGEGAIEGDVIRGTVTATRFAARGRDRHAGLALVGSDIG